MAEKKYGHFDDDNREYVITDPQTPWPWINYLGNEDFFSLISNTAGGYSFYKDAKFRRITRYRYNGVPMDNGGRYFYIKDGDTVWNPGWKPCKTPLDSYECRHGMNYTRITGSKNGVEASVLFFVPLHTWAEVQKMTLKNQSQETKTLKVFSFAEWCLWNAATDMDRTCRLERLPQPQLLLVGSYREFPDNREQGRRLQGREPDDSRTLRRYRQGLCGALQAARQRSRKQQ